LNDGGGTGNLEIEIRYSNVFGNDGDFEGTIAGLTTVANPVDGDPLLDAEYIPFSCSPTIDAGDPASDYSLEPEPNGGRVNLGHLGGTVQAVVGRGDFLNPRECLRPHRAVDFRPPAHDRRPNEADPPE
jgi:hypothetical protein